MEENVVYSRVTKGLYKDKLLVVKIAEKSGDCKVFIDDLKLDNVKSCIIHMEAGQVTTIKLELYAKN